MTKRSEVSMLPLVPHFTPELLDEFDPEFVKWMIATVTTDGAPEVDQVRMAVGKSKRFIRTVHAAMTAVKQTNEALGSGKAGEASLITLCLIAGWKLAEAAMERMGKESVS